MFEIIYHLLERIKEQRPLILNLTNTVTQDFIANGLLSLGASPIMANANNELYDLITIAHCVVINIGTLNEEFITLCQHACKIANELGKPLILDPVGAGASQFRTESCLQLLKHYQFALIRGNASEIMALCELSKSTKGVDSSMETTDVLTTAQSLSKKHKTLIVVSGKTDAVIQNVQVELFERGSSLMPQITGSGCLLTTVIGAFQTVHSNAYEAATAAVNFYGVCGEIAARKALGPGSFKIDFLDALAQLPARSDYEQ